MKKSRSQFKSKVGGGHVDLAAEGVGGCGLDGGAILSGHDMGDRKKWHVGVAGHVAGLCRREVESAGVGIIQVRRFADTERDRGVADRK